MSANVIQKSRSRSALIVTDGSQQDDVGYGRRLMIGPSSRVGYRNMQAIVENEVKCVPPIGSRIFW